MSPAPKLLNESEQPRDTLGSICVAVLVALGIVTVIATAVITIRSYSPYLVWDQWDQVGFLMRWEQHHKLLTFWDQHNEHRLPIQRLLCCIDLLYFGGVNKSLLVETFLIQCIHVGLLIWIVKAYGAVSKTVLLSVAGVVAYCLFSPLQIEVFYWAFETTFVLVALAASAAFACALYYSMLDPDRRALRGGIVALAVLCCFVAESSLASGLLAWPFFLLLAFKIKFERRHLGLIVVSAVLAIFAYFVHYHTPTYNSDPLQTIRQPGRVLSFVVGLLSYTWDSSPVRVLAWPRLSQAVTLIAIFGGISGALKCFLNQKCSRFQLFVFTNFMFTLATAVTTALGRLKYGYGHAETSRYQTISLMFWACIALLLASLASRFNLQIVRLVQIAIAVVLLSSVYRWRDMQKSAIDHQAEVKAGWIAMSHRKMSDPAIIPLYPNPALLPEWFDYMQANHLGAKPAD